MHKLLTTALVPLKNMVKEHRCAAMMSDSEVIQLPPLHPECLFITFWYIFSAKKYIFVSRKRNKARNPRKLLSSRE